MSYTKDQILNDYTEVNKCISSVDNKKQISACLSLILLFTYRHIDHVNLSVMLQNNLKIKELELKIK